MNISRRIYLIGASIVAKSFSLNYLIRAVDMKKIRSKFSFNGLEIDYLFHSYNNFGLTERSVEMPIIKYYLMTNKFKNVLEVGNVTDYYKDYFLGLFPNKTIVDKIEIEYNSITSDIALYKSDVKYDFIFSISTFEHMDSDLGRNTDYVEGKNKYGTVAADNIIHCYEELLAEGGIMVITAPLGYTPEWDATFKQDTLDKYPFKEVKKIIVERNSIQSWQQLEKVDMTKNMLYNSPFPYANYVSVFEIHK